MGRRDKGWTWLDWLGLIVYLVAWYVVLKIMLVPSQFIAGKHEIKLSGIGLLGVIALGIILLVVLLSGLKFRWALISLVLLAILTTAKVKALPASEEQCPVVIYGVDSMGKDFELKNNTSYPNLIEFALVHKAKEGSHGNLCDDWKQVFDAFCCWFGGCRSFYPEKEELGTLKLYPTSNRTFLLIDEGLNHMFRIEVKFSENFTYRCEDLGSPAERRDIILKILGMIVGSGVLVAFASKAWKEMRKRKDKPKGLPYHG